MHVKKLGLFAIALGAASPVGPFFMRAALADEEVIVDQPTHDTGDRYRIDRTWLYGDDARIPLPLVLIATSDFSYTNVGNSPTRISSDLPSGAQCATAAGVPTPCYSNFAGNVAQPGGMLNLGAELGVVSHLSVQATVMIGVGGDESIPSPNVGGTASLRFQVFPDAWTRAHLVVSAGYVREAWAGPVYDDDDDKWLPGSSHGDNGAWFQAAFSGDVQRLRLAGTFHGEHIFADGRDPLDIMVDLGASYRIAGGFRLGVEYVGQDLEESFDPEADGGARHFLGPIASIQLFHERLTVVAGPSLGLSRLSPDFVARLGASVGF